MISSIKSICLVLLLLLLAVFFTSTAFCKEKLKDSASSSIGIPSRIAGFLSMCPDNHNICIQFTTSHAKFTKAAAVGDLVMNKVPLEVLATEQADLIPIQKASYIAFQAWQKCQEAKELFEKAKELFKEGKIPSVQKQLVQWQWACSRANKYSAEEMMIGTKDILDNLGLQVEWAAPAHEISKLDYENAKQDEQNAIDLGAVPSVLGYELPGAEKELTLPNNFSEQPIASDRVVIDSPPISNTVSAVPFSDQEPYADTFLNR